MHYVRTGETLYSVSFQYGRSVDELASWNGLHKPYTIYKGQRLRLTPPPVRASKPKPARAKPAPKPVPRIVVTPSRPKPHYPSSGKPKRVTPAPAKTASTRAAPKVTTTESYSAALNSKHIRWSWPVQGRLISGYNAASSGRKGINIAGKTGAPVHTAAAGKVVYSGSGLSGYGRLIIIKHNKEFLSAYAHNRKLIAKEGQWVKQGEVIALMGSSGTDRTQLHFEIRKQGRPVNPLRYLPKR
ncbi:MAG TPA: LysM peptidoglycan-binding domain-containing protein [Gammaproteobacteria bacterium]|nr:LysM peptidoglycan-binding domain-containing protein [Gammaproteobacteria bacterium]